MNLIVHNLPVDRIENSLLTADQAANYLQVHPDTLSRWVRRGHFPRIPLPRLQGLSLLKSGNRRMGNAAGAWDEQEDQVLLLKVVAESEVR